MPKTTEEMLAHAQELAAKFENDDFGRSASPIVTDGLDGLAEAVIDRVNAEKNVHLWVAFARDQGKSWASIGRVLGTSGEAARQRYTLDMPTSDPAPNGARAPHSHQDMTSRVEAVIADLVEKYLGADAEPGRLTEFMAELGGTNREIDAACERLASALEPVLRALAAVERSDQHPEQRSEWQRRTPRR